VRSESLSERTDDDSDLLRINGGGEVAVPLLWDSKSSRLSVSLPENRLSFESAPKLMSAGSRDSERLPLLVNTDEWSDKTDELLDNRVLLLPDKNDGFISSS